MKPFPESIIDPVISDALAAVESAKETVRVLVRDTQSRCEHRFVSHVEWTTINPARRICNHCRLVERGSLWSGLTHWSKHDHSKPTLGNMEGRTITPVSQNEFWKMEIRT
jgi:hypothetical protein